ncbi:MAG TPA: PHB depolymerase family esterase [Beijerinckiaceae bacterium]|nr:PHB depolymerase family esterase [Beijerinckiaceae bacterium]
MSSLGSTIAALSRHRGQIGALTRAALSAGAVSAPDHLVELLDFGSNPGNLRAWSFVPKHLPAGAPLIVVLHGCGQSAGEYDLGAGWSALAEEIGAAALFPEQKPGNNSLMCFNWFSPRDTTREGGEALSIRQMIERIVTDQDLDRKRIFITGLSAGGAMAGALLALYPDVFAAGAIIAGLPVGAASNALEAISAMADGAEKSTERTGLARRASAHRGPWPRIAVWSGNADEVVHPSNSDRIVDQWLCAHGLEKEGGLIESAGYSHKTWRDRWGRLLVEQIVIDDMGHGTPVKASAPGAESNRYMLDVGMSSTRCIARFWGLLPGGAACAGGVAQASISRVIGGLQAAAKRLSSALQVPASDSASL